MGSTLIRTFIPEDTQPAEIFDDLIDRGVGRSLQIGIFNPQDQYAPVPFGQEEVKESGSGVPDVKKSCWGRSKADANSGGHLMPSEKC
jgi:hypothetical protein